MLQKGEFDLSIVVNNRKTTAENNFKLAEK